MIRKEKTVQEAFENGFNEGRQAQIKHIRYINQLLEYLRLTENQREELNEYIQKGRQEVSSHIYLFSERHPYDLFFRQSDTLVLDEEKLVKFDFETALAKSSLQRILDLLLKYSYRQRLGNIYLTTLACKIEFYQLRNKRYHEKLDSKIYQSDKQQIAQKVKAFWSQILPM